MPIVPAGNSCTVSSVPDGRTMLCRLFGLSLSVTWRNGRLHLRRAQSSRVSSSASALVQGTCKGSCHKERCHDQQTAEQTTGHAILSQRFSGMPRLPRRSTQHAATGLQQSVCNVNWEILANSVVASELVYRSVDIGQDAVQVLLQSYADTCFQAGLINVHTLSWSDHGAAQRYMIAESPSTMYVAFMGTKQARDFLTNARAWQEAFLEDALSAAAGKLPANNRPSVHSGFCKRADSVPIMQLWQRAQASSKRLVLTGHSLGGSVATVCTLRLLHELPASAHTQLCCVGFATPAVGNAALKQAVETAGWHKIITNITLPEDIVPHLLSWSPPQAESPVSTTDKDSTRWTAKRHASSRSSQQLYTSGLQLAQLSTLMTLMTTLLPRSASAACHVASAASSRVTLPLGWLGMAVSALPVTYFALRSLSILPGLLLLPPNLPQLVWSGGLFACYAAIATAKSVIRLGPAHYHMIGTQLFLSCDGQLMPEELAAEGKTQPLTTPLKCASYRQHDDAGTGCSCATFNPTILLGACCMHSKSNLSQPQSLLQRIQWQYAIHRMPPLRMRLQRAWERQTVVQ